MFKRIVTKLGEEIWRLEKTPVFGRHEIARLEFEKWEMKKKIIDNG